MQIMVIAIPDSSIATRELSLIVIGLTRMLAGAIVGR